MTQFAFVFPGQGSQAVGMLAEMAAAWPVIEETFGEASAALGYDLWALTQQGPAEELNKTWQTQPALLADNFLNAFFDSAHTLKFPIKTRFRDGFRSV